jgi:serine/threonine protein kinase
VLRPPVELGQFTSHDMAKQPANILLTEPASGRRRIVLADFGIARQANEASGLTATSMTVGSDLYAAPEQLTGDVLDGRAGAALATQVLMRVERRRRVARQEIRREIRVDDYLSAGGTAGETLMCDWSYGQGTEKKS